ncbi:anti-sigma factor family protein [Streptomyces spectabilis]|uniref:Zf-HC2 domain-containing protein n=1 Tax=Streptomyces spectabilis TaxID=68270 RepID=A0A516RD02_STRST|nr:zf-HC2 domain-containing protein [Streptomyces spectabilis]QDQ13514.1 zf-HC2 domain-containing protein [Streptomyces spectabilis]
MSGSRSNPAERHFAEQHLGDRLAALVDGELGHDARERVLAHLATCPTCKTEADAQRRLKSVFAQTAAPPPSESFLARLQNLPGMSLDDIEGQGGPRTPVDDGFATGSSGATGLPGGGVFSVGGPRPDPLLEYAPAGAHAAVLPSEQRGFRIHAVGRTEAERSGWRGRRFAFAAAGAVSLAAIALGGVTVSAPLGSADQRAGGSGANSNASPPRSQTTPATGVPESTRRRGSSPFSVQGQRPQAPAPTTAAVPLLSGAPGPSTPTPQHLTAPLLAGAGVMSPLVRAAAPDAPEGPGVPATGLTLNAAADTAPRATPPPGLAQRRGTAEIH